MSHQRIWLVGIKLTPNKSQGRGCSDNNKSKMPAEETPIY